MSDDFDSILDYCLAELEAGRLTLEGCVQRFPQHAARLAPLLKTAARARAMPPIPALPEDKRRAIASRLPNRATHFQRRPIRAGRWPAARRVWGMAAIAAIVCVVASAGVVAASAGSLPGDVLYPIKRTAENASLALAAAADRAELNIELAERRLDEFSALAKRGDIDTGLLDEMSSFSAQASLGISNLTGVRRAEALRRLVQLTEKQLAVLALTQERAPAAVRPALDQVTSFAESERQRALDLLKADSGPIPANDQPGSSSNSNVTSTVPAGTVATAATPEAPPTSVSQPNAQATPGRSSGKLPVTPPGQAKRTPDHMPPGQSGKPPEPGGGHGKGHGDGNGKPKK